MKKLYELKAVKTLEDFSNLLGYQPKYLAYILYKATDAEKYSTFTITKKSGGDRQICAPNERLKSLQRKLSDLLGDCCAEIEKNRGGKKYYFHGFSRGRSIITNAQIHKNRRYVLNIDIENFFPSINFGRIYGFFIKDNEFALSKKAAAIIAQISCFNNCLPQGSLCSPIIANLVGHLLDVRLARLAKANKCTYSRYADDLSFSTNQRDFPEALAAQPSEGEAWELGAALVGTIERSGFLINPSKTRMQLHPDRQMVTGLVVNKKVNVRAEYYRYARAMCHSLFTTGGYRLPEKSPASEKDNEKSAPSLNVLEGILGHIYHVREGRYINNQNEPKTVGIKKSNVVKFDRNGSATTELYRKFLFYRRFVAPDLPVIICEGKTDAVYLRAALKKLADKHPHLVDVKTGLRKAHLFNYSRVSDHVLGLGGGSDMLKNFICAYAKNMAAYNGITPAQPVIVIIDNDSGATGIFGYMHKHNPKPSLTSTENFYRVSHNLYIVKTPEIGTSSCMETLFPDAILATSLDGKTFNLTNDKCSPTQYGKHVFAEKVVKPNIDKIDFSGFSTLLDRIAAAIAHYKT